MKARVGPDGLVIEDRAINRTARYDFTSSLPVQILKMLGPTLDLLIADRED